MPKVNKSTFYWISQITGWGSYILLAVIQIKLNGEEIDSKIISNLFLVYIFGILFSHFYRLFLIKIGWLKLGIIKLIPRIFVGAIVGGLIFELFFFITEGLILMTFSKDLNALLQEILSWSLLIFIWSLLYFTYHFFENFRKEEIKNLQYEATKNELELNRLKSQLNPHFIFNSMNTIKALVEDQPSKAKTNITKLSNILRGTLLSGKKKTTTLKEELDLVKDYLDLEHTRFEERLYIEYQIEEQALSCKIPPMLLQTLVENGIKHGISKLTKGGIIRVSCKMKENYLEIKIFNTGKLESNYKHSGIGLTNSMQRLKLLYGEKAKLNIYNLSSGVEVLLHIPKIITNEA